MWCKSSSTAYAAVKKWCSPDRRFRSWARLRCISSKFTESTGTRRTKKWKSEANKNRLATTITFEVWAHRVSIQGLQPRRDQLQRSTLIFLQLSSNAVTSWGILTASDSRTSNNDWFIYGNADMIMAKDGLRILEFGFTQTWDEYNVEMWTQLCVLWFSNAKNTFWTMNETLETYKSRYKKIIWNKRTLHVVYILCLMSSCKLYSIK